MATTPRQVIASVLGLVCGHGVDQLVRLTTGGMNETYRVELAGAGSVVVRIARQSVPWFTDEEHIMAQARALGVPTAEVLGVEHVEHDGELLSFSIQQILPGRSLDELAGELSRWISSGWSWTPASCWRECTASCPTAGSASSSRRSVRRRPRSSSVVLSFSVASRRHDPRHRWCSRKVTGCPSTS